MSARINIYMMLVSITKFRGFIVAFDAGVAYG